MPIYNVLTIVYIVHASTTLQGDSQDNIEEYLKSETSFKDNKIQNYPNKRKEKWNKHIKYNAHKDTNKLETFLFPL